MKRFISAVLLMGLAFKVFAFNSEANQETASPFPDSNPGINIWPLEKIEKDYLPNSRGKYRQSMNAMRSQGYEETSEVAPRINRLLSIKKNGRKKSSFFDDDNKNPQDTHIKSSLYKIQRDFKFTGVPGIKKEDVIGYAPTNTYQKDKGWTGMVEFFEHEKLGVCSYENISVRTVILDQESLENFINKKYSYKHIAGNSNIGFLYDVTWYDKSPARMHTFECVNKLYEPSILAAMIELAKETDKAQDVISP